MRERSGQNVNRNFEEVPNICRGGVFLGLSESNNILETTY